MPRERFPPDDPREWLNRARSSLVRAKHVLPDAYLEDLCFDAQQAAEKSIKAVFVLKGIDFPFVHDLSRLLSLLEKHGCKVPDKVKRAEGLTRFAVEFRYPGVSGPVSRLEYQRAVRMSESVVRWATGEIYPLRAVTKKGRRSK